MEKETAAIGSCYKSFTLLQASYSRLKVQAKISQTGISCSFYFLGYQLIVQRRLFNCYPMRQFSERNHTPRRCRHFAFLSPVSGIHYGEVMTLEIRYLKTLTPVSQSQIICHNLHNDYRSLFHSLTSYFLVQDGVLVVPHSVTVWHLYVHPSPALAPPARILLFRGQL